MDAVLLDPVQPAIGGCPGEGPVRWGGLWPALEALLRSVPLLVGCAAIINKKPVVEIK